MIKSISFRRTGVVIIVTCALTTVATFAVPSIRECVLRTAGWALVVEEPLLPADVIVVSLESEGAGTLEAADLFKSGISNRVAVFVDPPSGYDHEFIRRGLLTTIGAQGKCAS